MDLNRYNTFVEKMLNLNLKIDNRFTKFTRFVDEEVENKFQKEREQKDKYQKILSDIILICGYIASTIYIFFAFYKISFLVLCLSCFGISTILITISYFIKDRKINYIINHIEILLITISLNVKGNLLNFVYNTPQEDNYAELVRIIIYDFVSGNLFVLVKLEAHCLANFFYFALNLFLIITSSMYSKVNRFYFLEGFTSFLFTFIFFFLRKAWDYRARVIFAEKYKFERLFKYTTDFIIGLNAYHVNIKNNEIAYSDEKLNYLVEDLTNNFEDFRKIKFEENEKSKKEKEKELSSQLGILDSKNYLIDELEINNNNNFAKKYLTSSTNGTEDVIHFEENINLKCFLKHLFLYIDENEVDVSKTNANTNNNENSNSKGDLSNGNNLNGNAKENSYEESKENYDNSVKNPKNIFSGNEQLKKESLFLHLSKIKKLEFDFIAKERFKEGETNNLNDNNNKKISDANLTRKQTNNNFLHLGIYHFKNPEIRKYYDVYYRGISIDESNTVFDFLFYDVSELINSKKIIYEENLIKQKVLAKIAHEFKTPINSIIGLINNLKENLSDDFNIIKEKQADENAIVMYSYDNNKQEIKNNKVSEQLSKNIKTLDIIQNLSRYIIFLVSDIIQFSTIREIHQINIHNKRINIREIANFSYEILNCLLRCNSSKYQKVKTFLKYEDEIDNIVIKIDEIRLKQIILNIISNAVKFTKCGHIKITFKIEENNEFLKIIISDTGIGIKDSDKEKLFNDYVMLGDGVNLNSQGSGLGLSICKSLAMKMNLMLNFKSKYGDGSKFYIRIPIKKDLNKSSTNLIKSLDNFRSKIDFADNKRNINLKNLIERGSFSSRGLSKYCPNKLDKNIQNGLMQCDTRVRKENAKFNFNGNQRKEKENKLVKEETQGLIESQTNSNIKIIEFENESNGPDSQITIDRNIENDRGLNSNNVSSSLIDLEQINRINEECSNDSQISFTNKSSNFINTENVSLNDNEIIDLSKLPNKKIHRESRKESFNSRLSNSNKMSYNYNNITINYNINNNDHQKIFQDQKNKKYEDLILSNLEKINEKQILINTNSLNNRFISQECRKMSLINLNPNNIEASKLNEISKNMNYNKVKIMIVEDNQFINDSLKKLLEKVIKEAGKDFEILQMTDGIDMIKQVIDDQSNGNLIKCILTDENMEYINGSEATKILRTLERRNKIKNVKILSISCQEDNAAVKMMLDSGADLVLGKPLSKTLISTSLTDLKII